MSSVDYHLAELEIALDKSDPRHVLPDLQPGEQFILDIGCGIGQTFLALDCLDRNCVGLDIDLEAIRYGEFRCKNRVRFIQSDARRLPLPDSSFDLVFSRYALLYTNIPRVVTEIRRVLKPGGRFWVTVAPRRHATERLRTAARAKRLPTAFHQLYALCNGYVFKWFGFLLPFVNGSYESWQDARAMKRLLRKKGFVCEVTQVGTHTIVEGVLPERR